MRYGLGIDAGGTYTDGVIYDFSTKKIIAKGKALTTKQDLGIGISNVILTLPPDQLRRVALVSLSTTLATNAIVEGIGNTVGAIVLGFDRYDLDKIAHKPLRSVRGKTDILGVELEALDEEGLRRMVEDLEQKETPSAYAVSGMVGVKNPAHELRAKEIVENLTHKPVVCGHEVSNRLDSIRRTNTAILNARLLPIIEELIDKIKNRMVQFEIHAPLMIVRADGRLMSEATAKLHPVETILSGPAASIWGARFLTNVQDGLVIDIGGTTSDIALIVDGEPLLSPHGARIGDWTTNVRSVDIDTIGLAGDSTVSVSRNGELSLGPRRAVPIAVLGHEQSGIIEEMKRLYAIRESRSSLIQPVEFFRVITNHRPKEITNSEKRALETLRDGPLSRDQMGERMGVIDPSMVPTDRLEKIGVLQRATLTPTDILHVQGTFSRWNVEASRWALRLFAQRLNIEDDTFGTIILDNLSRRLTEHLITHIMKKNGSEAPQYPLGFSDNLEDCELLKLLSSQTNKFGFHLQSRYDHPLIVIGAPAGAFGPAIAQRLGAQVIIPENAEVANALGAITGIQSIVVEAILEPNIDQFIVHSPVERRSFDDLEEAKEWAKNHVLELLDHRIAEEGQKEFNYHKEIEITDQTGATKDGSIFLESTIRGVGLYKPALG
jgi:N-methylhydantoinase A/oxoprolinase/acetone carboxylase beta subunit